MRREARYAVVTIARVLVVLICAAGSGFAAFHFDSKVPAAKARQIVDGLTAIQADIDGGLLVNTATATGTPARGVLPLASGSTFVESVRRPALEGAARDAGSVVPGRNK